MFNKIKSLIKSAIGAASSSKDKERQNPGEVAGAQLWYPHAQIMDFEMKTNGYYPDKYPKGAIVHFTSGWARTEQDAINTLKGGLKNGYAFFMIGPTGKVYQAHPLNRWGSHAGESKWPGLGSNVSQKLVGIEIACAGKVKEVSEGLYKTWFGQSLDSSQVRESQETDTIEKGFYHTYTLEQELALIDLLVWLYLNNPMVFNVDYILGHCEVAGKKGLGYWRKNDPGASLSMTLPELRGLVKNKILQKLEG